MTAAPPPKKHNHSPRYFSRAGEITVPLRDVLLIYRIRIDYRGDSFVIHGLPKKRKPVEFSREKHRSPWDCLRAAGLLTPEDFPPLATKYFHEMNRAQRERLAALTQDS